MGWFCNPKDIYCHNKDAYLDFVDKNYISSYCRFNASNAYVIKDVLITGRNRFNSTGFYHSKYTEIENLPIDLIKYGIFFKTDDSQIIYAFSTNYSADRLDGLFNECKDKLHLDIRVKDKSENFLVDNCNLVIISIMKRELPILK